MKEVRIKNRYRAGNKSFWSGRDTESGVQYWYQAARAVSIDDLDAIPKAENQIGLLGYACDEGVKRNLGRIGAKLGPNVVRERLGKLPFHVSDKEIFDFGNVNCDDGNLEETQRVFSDLICRILDHDIFPIALGGGHDLAYAHYKGIQKHLPKNSKIGIVNFDAHFDLRQMKEKPNSGTPFNQIIAEHGDTTEYMVLGIQRSANTPELYEVAKNANVKFIENYECTRDNLKVIQESLTAFSKDKDAIYITIDMDGFSSAYAPGVSAPSPLGFTPYFVVDCLKFLFETELVVAMDIAELNPLLDRDDLSANLAARIVDFCVGIC